MIVVVRSDDENLKGISIFSHAALKLNPPECYHLVVPGQQNNASDLQKFRDERYGRAAAKAAGMGMGMGMVKYVHTPLAYVSENDAENGIIIPASIERLVFKNVVETAVQVSGHEGVWHEGVFMILAASTRMADVTAPLKTGRMVEKFVAAGHTFGSEDVCVKFKGQLQDLMGWGDVVVVDHEGAIVGIARGCHEVDSPLTVGYNFDAKYDVYLKFAHRHECVMVVRSDSAANGICVFSHEALVDQASPECYRIVTVSAVTGHEPPNKSAPFFSSHTAKSACHSLTPPLWLSGGRREGRIQGVQGHRRCCGGDCGEDARGLARGTAG